MKSTRLLSQFALLPLLLCGCVSGARVHSAEVKIANEQTYQGRLDYAEKLAEKYIELADEATGAQDVAAMGIITAAAVGAGGLLYGAHVDLLKGAGLAAGTITATRGYAKPAETAGHLYNAAEALLCIQSVGVNSPQVESARSILNEGINKVRINLRRNLVQDTPNYGELLNQIRGTYIQKIEAAGQARVLSVEEELRERINECILTSVSS
ncbi:MULTISPECIES: hypothetical protein [Sinorhizobium]|uniref:hypothetical protein n=1 Tax=Sinorhizobium TaxID=28105 RepID=UPI001185CDB6|nr:MULTISPECIES: hypothetical protein [Sinorhizobium]